MIKLKVCINDEKWLPLLVGWFPQTVKRSLTSPGWMVPTDGETVTGAPLETTNSKEVGPTGAISPEKELFFY